jgi:hypothetical protein
MRAQRHFGVAVLGVAALAVLLGGAGQAQADIIAHLVLDSQPGDFVGGGKHSDVTYTPANTAGGLFHSEIDRFVSGQPAYLFFDFAFSVNPGPDEFTTLAFATDQLGIPFAVGTYPNAQRAPFATAGHPGLDVTFEHRGSNTLTGNFTVNSVSFFTDSSNTVQIGSLDVNFEQHSEGATPALFGHFTYGPQATAAVPEPSTLALLSLGGIGLAGWRRWKKRRAAV